MGEKNEGHGCFIPNTVIIFLNKNLPTNKMLQENKFQCLRRGSVIIIIFFNLAEKKEQNNNCVKCAGVSVL